MPKDDRKQIPPPVLTPPSDQRIAEVEAARQQLRGALDAVGSRPVAAPLSPVAARAIASGPSLAHDYAQAAASLCDTADRDPVARTNAKRLLRLALAHLE